jgi:RNA polymerase sigma-70 factor (ECF subfamily)
MPSDVLRNGSAAAGESPDSLPAGFEIEAGAFYDQWFPLVYRYFRRRTSDTETAEDLTAETFERILKALPRFQPGPEPVRSTRVWVYRIAGNVYKNTLRRWSREKVRHENYAEDWHESSDRRDESDRSILVARALQQLDPPDRNIVGLRFWEGLTAREIAEVVDLSQREVYTAIERCIRQLRRTMRPLLEEVERVES